MMVDKRERLETLRKFANIPDFRALAFLTAYQTLVQAKINYSIMV